MKLVVKNLGAIKKKSEIDLTKRFYTFVGYNNSGKTYISQVIWYLFSEFETALEFEIGNYLNKAITEDIGYYELEIKELLEVYNYTLKKYSLNLLGLINISEIVLDLVIPFDKNTNKTALIFPNNDDVISHYFLYEKVIDKNIIKISLEKLDKPFNEEEFINYFKNYFKMIRAYSYSPHNSENLINMLKNSGLNLLHLFSENFIEHNFFLPSSRTFLPSYYKYLSKGYEQERNEIGEIVRKNPKDTDKIKFLTKKRHTSAVDSVLNKLNTLSSKSEIKPFYADLIADLEKLMQGSIGVENVEGIANSEFGFKVDSKTTLEMYQTSTSVNQLTLLYLYLKYWTEESNNFLIIDEPEENLHPENQIKLLDILVKFANRNNNRVLFTTHSPLMAEAVNNHAHITLLRERGEDVEKIIKDHNLTISPNNSANDTLKHSDYATYFFNGEAIKEYPMTDFGVFFRDFKEAEDKVRTTANTLKEYIYNSQNKKENGEKLSE